MRRALTLAPLVAWSWWPNRSVAAQPGRTLSVGGPADPSLAEALRSAREGDTVEIHGDLHGEAGVIEQPGLTLRGMGRRPVLHADGRSAEGKATIVVRANDVRIQHLEFRGARVPSGNGAGIRFESGSLRLSACAFFDNENGLLAANRRDMSLTIEDCEFGEAPRHAGLLHHLLYVGAIGRFAISGSRFGHGWRGHLLKSRALENVITGNWLYDGVAGEASYELELPNGGHAVIVGNVIGQGVASDNPSIVSIGAESRPDAAPSAIHLAHNTIVNHGSAQARFVQFWTERLGPGSTLNVLNNVFAGPGAMAFSDAQDAGGNVQIELSDLVDAAQADFRLRQGVLPRALAVVPAGVAGASLTPTTEWLWPSGTRPMRQPPRWSGAPFGAR